MKATAPQLRGFARRLHQRFVLLRMSESAGAGLLTGGAAALLVLPVLLYRSQSALSFMAWVLPAATVCGAVWGLVRRPTMLDALMRADQQLRSSDLLSTAWMLGEPASDDFSIAVLKLAEARATDASPASIVLRRFGRRMWGAVAVTTVLACAMGMISANPIESGSQTARRALASNGGSNRKPTEARTGHNGASGSASANTLNPDSKRNDDRGLDTSPNVAVATLRDPGGANANSAADPRGTGSGYGRSNSSNSSDPLLVEPGNIAQSQGTASNGASGGSADNAAHSAATPWSSERWMSGREEATAALRDGRVPAAYHDIVRDYFIRD